MSDIPPTVCRVCKRPLARHTIKGVTSWHHHDVDILGGHKPDPVPAAEAGVAGRCDFCSSADPQFILPAHSFIAGVDAHGRAQGLDGNWACCEACAKFIDTNNWTGLARHVQRVWETAHGVPMPPEKDISNRHLWRLLRKHISGSIRPINQ